MDENIYCYRDENGCYNVKYTSTDAPVIELAIPCGVDSISIVSNHIVFAKDKMLHTFDYDGAFWIENEVQITMLQQNVQISSNGTLLLAHGTFQGNQTVELYERRFRQDWHAVLTTQCTYDCDTPLLSQKLKYFIWKGSLWTYSTEFYELSNFSQTVFTSNNTIINALLHSTDDMLSYIVAYTMKPMGA